MRTHEQASAGAEAVSMISADVLPSPSIVNALAEVFQECQMLAKRKSVHYGDAWRRQGYMGNVARVLSKSERVRSMMWRGECNDEELSCLELATEEELLDIINIAAMGVINLRSRNRWGNA